MPAEDLFDRGILDVLGGKGPETTVTRSRVIHPRLGSFISGDEGFSRALFVVEHDSPRGFYSDRFRFILSFC
jgi:hypothetical protein